MESRKRIRRKASRSRVVAKPAIAQSPFLPNIAALIDNGGDITVGALPPIRCVASACAEYGCLAMLQRRLGESLQHLLERLDAAIEYAETEETVIDEIKLAVNIG